jgi:hypothetical protein
MAKRRPAVRFEPPPGTDLPVLTARGGRVRGELVLRNDGRVPVSVPAVRIRTPDELGTPLVESWQAPELPPGEVARASLGASLDRLTPPGTYTVELELDGVVQPALLRVAEDVSLTLSERELVVVGDAGVEQTRTLLVTNRGNVPLLVRRIGPVDLEEDVPRPSLLERLGVLPPETDAPRATLLQRMGVVGYVRAPTASPDDRQTTICIAERDDEPRPTLTARLREAVTVAPGEVANTEWIVTVEGPLRPGVRYRATAPLYTADLTFVVTPSQAEPPDARPTARRARSRSAAATAASRPRAASSPSKKRRET